MEKTTIQISKKVKEEISTFGMKGETFDVIIKRMYDLAVKENLRQFLMSSEGYTPIEQAIKEAKKKWSK
jgi:transcriptional regulator